MVSSGMPRVRPQVVVLSVAASSAAALLCAGSASANIYSGTGGFLPDAPSDGVFGVATFQINVTDLGSVASFNGLTVNGFTHAFLGDLGATLTAPDGTVVTIFDRISKTSPDSGFGDSSNFLGSYTFANGGGNIWSAAAAVPGSSNVPQGTYFASAALTGAPIDLQAFLAGRDVHGLWTLTITDFSVGDAGSISGWSLDMTVVPAPSAMGLVAAAGLVGRRRRR